jgi:4-hydroxy-tetrahydrodipicolinate reductase
MTYRIIQWTTGHVGKHALKQIIENSRMELVGVHVTSAANNGVDAGALCGIPDTGVRATRDVDALLTLDADCVS